MANLQHNTSSRQFEENGSQGTPGSGLWELYFDSDGGHIKDDAGNVIDIVAAPSSEVTETTFMVPAAAMSPSDGESPEAVVLAGTNNTVDAYRFDGTVIEATQFAWTPPPQWDAGTVQLEIVWRTNGGTAAEYVRFGAQAVAVGDDETSDAAFGTLVEVEDVITVDGDDQRVTTGDITIAGTPTASKTIYFRIERTHTGVTATKSLDELDIVAIRGHYSSNVTNAIDVYLTRQTLVDAATVDYDISNGVNAKVTLAGDRALADPNDGGSNPLDGVSGNLIIIQDATGGRALTKPANMTMMEGDFAEILNMAADAEAVLSWVSVGGGLTKGWLVIPS